MERRLDRRCDVTELNKAICEGLGTKNKLTDLKDST